MMYAHIFEHKDKICVSYRYVFKFEDEEEKNGMEPKLLATLSEESGDMVLLDKQIVEWKACHSIERIEGFEDFSGIAFPDDKEYISALRQEAHRVAEYLRRERQEKEKAQEEKRKLLKQIDQLIEIIKTRDVAADVWKESIEDDEETIAAFAIEKGLAPEEAANEFFDKKVRWN